MVQILPTAIVSLMYSGKIEFGVINQSVFAFNHILGDFSLIAYQIQANSAFTVVIDRLGEFDDVWMVVSLHTTQRSLHATQRSGNSKK